MVDESTESGGSGEPGGCGQSGLSGETPGFGMVHKVQDLGSQITSEALNVSYPTNSAQSSSEAVGIVGHAGSLPGGSGG